MLRDKTKKEIELIQLLNFKERQELVQFQLLFLNMDKKQYLKQKKKEIAIQAAKEKKYNKRFYDLFLKDLVNKKFKEDVRRTNMEFDLFLNNDGLYKLEIYLPDGKGSQKLILNEEEMSKLKKIVAELDNPYPKDDLPF